MVARELYTVAVVPGLELLRGAVSMAPKFSQFSPKKREREQCREVQFRVYLCTVAKVGT